MEKRYKTRDGGATVTVFVPYDCRNHCPFCVNKEEYSDTSAFSLERICESIRRLDGITPYCDFVFTGGEPLSDLCGLETMLSCISKGHRIFINTTLPVFDGMAEDEFIRFFEKNKDRITCVNISRHLEKYVQESPDRIIEKLPVKFRINCVLFNGYDKKKLIPFIERFKAIPGASIQFRADYTQTTPENLYDKSSDRIFKDLSEIAGYRGLDGCRMRCGFHFDYHGMDITYHRTLPYSTVFEVSPEGTAYEILYDILIKQTGAIHSDWSDAVKKDLILDIEAYKNAVFEPYDLKWIEKF